MCQRGPLEFVQDFGGGGGLAHSEPTVHSSSMKALAVLTARVARLATAGMLDDTDTGVDDATLHVRALCDGLAGLEIGGTIRSDAGERLWRAGLGALVRGFTAPEV